VIVVLVLLQAGAMQDQFASGFRPFAQEPTRQPFSWDMFAIRISRCNILWTPPLKTRTGLEVTSMADLSVTIEWNPVMNTIEQYMGFAMWMCKRSLPAAMGIRHARLICFSPDMGRTTYDLPCH
jgi:hypothetical protein